MKKAWESFRFFNANGMALSFAAALKRAWSFVKAALKPVELDLSAWTKGS